ncbi:hypothetical protein LCGC14_2526270 [marine sediment metagenome]|uniref:Uncharacterized protein n=1 Tax=marine sediment metagenome TaxID=412755 RepID=A0A0F9AUW9_9ZZZZ
MKTVIAKINAGVPNYRMKDKMVPPSSADDKGNFINGKVWPRHEKGIYKGKLIHGGWLIVKGEKYQIPDDYDLNQKNKNDDPVGLGTIFREEKQQSEKPKLKD